MKIALACAVFPPEGSNGGMATFYLEVSRALVSLVHDVLVVNSTLLAGALIDGIEYFSRSIKKKHQGKVF